jgi:hypothetical protein
MFLYKLRKLLKKEGGEIVKMSLGLAFVFASSVFLVLLMIIGELDGGTKKEKFIMFFSLALAGLVNMGTLLYLDNNLGYNILIKLSLGVVINFIIYVPVFFVISVVGSYRELKLNKDEERDIKLSSLLNKFR